MLSNGEKTYVDVIFPTDHRMHFSGKGAGAGMMLMSTMDPMGIAIGAAIDEGISKDIAKSASTAELDLEAMLKETFSSYKGKELRLSVEKYGFIISPKSGGDATLAQLHLKIMADEGKEETALKIPGDVLEQCELLEVDLTELKQNGELAIQAFQSASECGLQVLSP